MRKWILGTTAALILVLFAVWAGLNHQVKQHVGAYTQVVDPEIFGMNRSNVKISNVSVLSTDCTKMLDNLDVLIKNGTIVSVSANMPDKNSYTNIDGSGKYLIPGLADTHVHLDDSKNDLMLYVANGVTSVAEMFGNRRHIKWKKEAKENPLSPHIYVASKKLGSKKGIMPKVRSLFGAMPNYATPEKARKAVRSYKRKGYDAIKLSSFLEPQIYQSIVDESVKQNIPAIGHLSLEVSLESLYHSGQSQLAHVEEITKSVMWSFGGIDTKNPDKYLNHLQALSDSIAINLKKNDIVVSSTIWIIESFPKQKHDLENFLKTLELEYANPGGIEGSKLARGWLPGNNSYESLEIKNDPEKAIYDKIYWNTYAKAVQIMTMALNKHKVKLITGTDANGACTVPGFSLHDELESLNYAGMSTSEVLYAATVAPAQWMSLNTGKIEEGYDADLLLLNQNPLVNINNTRSIETVINKGHVIDRAALNDILNKIREANDRSRKTNIDQFI